MIRKSLSLWSLIIIFSSNIVLPMETGSSQQSGRSSDYRLLVAARKRTAQAIRKIGLIIAYKDLQEDITAFYWLPQELRMRSMVNANQEFCQALKRIESEPSFQSLSVEDQQNKRTELAEKDAVRLQLSRNMTYETNDMSSADRFNLATRRIGLLVEYIMLQEHIDIEDLEAERIADMNSRQK